MTPLRRSSILVGERERKKFPASGKISKCLRLLQSAYSQVTVKFWSKLKNDDLNTYRGNFVTASFANRQTRARAIAVGTSSHHIAYLPPQGLPSTSLPIFHPHCLPSTPLPTFFHPIAYILPPHCLPSSTPLPTFHPIAYLPS